MSPYLVTGLAAALLGAVLAGGTVHRLDSTALAHEQAAHAKDNTTHATEIAQINAASAKALSDALAKQQVAEGKVSDIETQYNTEVANHAKDSLNYRAQLATGAQRLRVHVTGCSVGAPSKSPSAAVSTDAATASADLSPTVATGVVAVADSADDTAMRLAALQAYVKALQDQGYIGK